QGDFVVGPLPDLGAGALRGRGVLHQVVDGHRAAAAQPRGQVLDGDVDVVAQARLGDAAFGAGDVQQVSGGHRHVVALPVDLVGAVAQHTVEDLHSDGDQVGVGHPRAVEAVVGFAGLVVTDLGQRHLVDLGVAPVGDERGHAADSMRAALVAGDRESVV